MKTPPKYPSTKHWPWSQTVHRDDSVLSIENAEKFVGCDVVVTEKLDGGNTCLWNGGVYARSTGQEATQGWFAMVKKHHSWKTNVYGVEGANAIVLYGEDLYGIHSIEYDPLKEDETFYLFAVRFAGDKLILQPYPEYDGDVFLDWDTVVNVSINFSMKHVPVVFRGQFQSVDEITKFFESQLLLPSTLGPQREGFVMRIASAFNAADFETSVTKYVRANHVQTDEHWTRNWQPAQIKR